MRVELKQKDKHKWVDVEIDKLKDLSRVDFIEDEFTPTVAAIYRDDDTVGLVVANTDDLKKYYEDKGIMFITASLLKIFLTDPVCPTEIIQLFPDSVFVKTESLQEK